jgi:hypothetical protein
VAQKETHGGQAEKFLFAGMNMAEFAAMGKRRLEEFTQTQSELFDKLQKTNQQWLDRIQVEANSVSEFASKLTGSRSMPDAMTACQEWAGQCFEMLAEDRKHLLDDYQKFAEIGARLLSTGWQSKGSEIST